MAGSKAHRIKLTYPQSLLDRPVLYQLITEFQLVANVLEASVNPEQGWLVLELEGSAAAILHALQWLAEEGIQVEHLPRP